MTIFSTFSNVVRLGNQLHGQHQNINHQRSFSILKIIRRTDRNRLAPGMAEHIMRVKMNGPPIHLFKALKYVEYYLDPTKNNFRCDNPAAGGQTKKSTDNESCNEEEDEFGIDVAKDFKNKKLLSGKSTLF